jgi:hypothetical protein
MRSSDKIAFILTILIVHHNHELTVLYIFDGTFYRIKHTSNFCKVTNKTPYCEEGSVWSLFPAICTIKLLLRSSTGHGVPV